MIVSPSMEKASPKEMSVSAAQHITIPSLRGNCPWVLQVMYVKMETERNWSAKSWIIE